MRARGGAKMTLRGLLRQGHRVGAISLFPSILRAVSPKRQALGRPHLRRLPNRQIAPRKRGFWIGPPGPGHPRASARKGVPWNGASLNWGFVDPPSGHRVQVVDGTRQAIAKAPPAPIQNPHHAEATRFWGTLAIRDLGGRRGRPRTQPQRADPHSGEDPATCRASPPGPCAGWARILPPTPVRWRRSRPQGSQGWSPWPPPQRRPRWNSLRRS